MTWKVLTKSGSSGGLSRRSRHSCGSGASRLTAERSVIVLGEAETALKSYFADLGLSASYSILRSFFLCLAEGTLTSHKPENRRSRRGCGPGYLHSTSSSLGDIVARDI